MGGLYHWSSHTVPKQARIFLARVPNHRTFHIASTLAITGMISWTVTPLKGNLHNLSTERSTNLRWATCLRQYFPRHSANHSTRIRLHLDCLKACVPATRALTVSSLIWAKMNTL